MDSSSDSDGSPCLAIDNLRIINLRKKDSHTSSVFMAAREVNANRKG